jgi:hypothetical protein
MYTYPNLLDLAPARREPIKLKNCFVCGRFGKRRQDYGTEMTCTRCTDVFWFAHEAPAKQWGKTRTFHSAMTEPPNGAPWVREELYFDHSQGLVCLA